METGKSESLAKPPPLRVSTTTSGGDWLRCCDCREEYLELIDNICWSCHTRYGDEKRIKQKNDERIIKSIGEKGFSLYTLDKFKPDVGSQKAFDACRNFGFEKSLYLWGPAGCGKTHLAGAVFRSWQKAEFFKSTELVRWFRLRDPREEEEEIRRLAAVPVIVIDDLGIQKDTEHVLTVMYEILDRRDMNMKKGLILTSNLSLSALAEKMGDDRIPSRIAGMCDVIELKGKDRRVSK